MDAQTPTLFDHAEAEAATPNSSLASPAGARAAEHAAPSTPASGLVSGAQGGPTVTVPASPTARAVREEPPTLLAVDGDALVHRAYHGYAGARSGRYGFFALLAAVCDQVPADALVVGFDSRTRSVRREREPEYKAHRTAKDDALVALLAQLPADCADLGLAVEVAEGWEADDVVASAAARAEVRGWKCAVVTSDRDAYAVATEATTVVRVHGGDRPAEHLTPRKLERRLGVHPRRYVEYAALRGDTSDNLPGVPGIGPRRAAALLAAFDDVEDAAADPIGTRSVLGPSAGQALLDDLARDGDSVYRRNVALMGPRRDLPVDLDAAARRPRPDHVAAVLADWGLGGLAGRMVAAVAARPDAPPPPDAPLDP